MSDAMKTEPTLEAKAEAVLAQMVRLADTTPSGVELRGGGNEYSIAEAYGTGRSWRLIVPSGDSWTATVDALFDMLCTTRGRSWR